MNIRCSECGNIDDAKSVLKEEWKYVDGNEIRLTYFICTKCDSIHIVQLDDKQSLMYLEEVGDKLKKVGEYKTKKQTPKKKLLFNLKRKNKELSRHRKFLNHLYSDNGKTVAIEGRIVQICVEMQEYVE